MCTEHSKRPFNFQNHVSMESGMTVYYGRFCAALYASFCLKQHSQIWQVTSFFLVNRGFLLGCIFFRLIFHFMSSETIKVFSYVPDLSWAQGQRGVDSDITVGELNCRPGWDWLNINIGQICSKLQPYTNNILPWYFVCHISLTNNFTFKSVLFVKTLFHKTFTVNSSLWEMLQAAIVKHVCLPVKRKMTHSSNLIKLSNQTSWLMMSGLNKKSPLMTSGLVMWICTWKWCVAASGVNLRVYISVVM